MNRYLALAAMAALTMGCAADFAEDGTTDQAPDIAEGSDDPTIRTFNGELQRPLTPVGAVSDAQERAEAAKILHFYRSVEQSDIELGTKYARSTK